MVVFDFDFQKIDMVFRWGQSLGTNLGFLEGVENR